MNPIPLLNERFYRSCGWSQPIFRNCFPETSKSDRNFPGEIGTF
jgi:hypothetical protein